MIESHADLGPHPRIQPLKVRRRRPARFVKKGKSVIDDKELDRELKNYLDSLSEPYNIAGQIGG